MIAFVGPSDGAEEQYRTLDFSGMSFPSDSLSMGALRKAHPKLFDHGFDDGEAAQPQFFFNAKHSEEILASMLFCERLIATVAYAEALGMAPPRLELPMFQSSLTKLYVRYGIASGLHHAEQLIRDIERQGAELASQRRR